jgi:DNA-binding GntR family transcriptional regulator
MASLTPVKLPDQIAQVIRERVLTCRLRPGERLVEKPLCAELGVSRSSLREALARLAQEHVLDRVPNKGFRVPRLTLARFRTVCEVRRAVEPEVAALAAERASAEDLRSLRAGAAFVPEHDDPELDALLCIRVNREFHGRIARAARNEMLEKIVLGALDQDNQPYFYGIDLHSCTDPDTITREHHRIVDAIEAGDAEEARVRMREHVCAKEERIAHAWNEAGWE